MNRIFRSPWAKGLAKFLAMVIVLEYTAICMPPAQAQAAKQTTAVAVIPFTDSTGYKSQVVSAKATDAFALALEDSGEFVVTSQSDLQREMKGLSLAPPLLESEQVRLGKRLRVDKIISGSIQSLSIEAKTGRCSVIVDMRALDVNTEEYLNGAAVSVTTKVIPGWEGDEVRVINEALREAAESAVQKMLATRIPRGNVDLVDDLGTITLSVGTRDGITSGRELLVARAQWQPDQEKVYMRKIGIVAVEDVEANLCRAHFVSGLMPRTGDKVYALYRPGENPSASAGESSGGGKHGGGIAIVAGLLLLAGIIGAGGGSNNSSAPESRTSGLKQNQDGDAPWVHLTFSTPGNAREATHGWLIYRGQSVPPQSTPQYLIDMFSDEGAHITTYDDNPSPTTTSVSGATVNFVYTGSDGNPETAGSVTATYNHLAMVAGQSYYYVLQRIISPLFPPGTNPPTATTTQTTVTPTLTLSPNNTILSQTSSAMGPFTYILPPKLVAGVPDGSVTQNPSSIEFQWVPDSSSTGPRVLYHVEVYGDDGTLIDRSQEMAYTNRSPMTFTISGHSSLYPSGHVYRYKVGARVSCESAISQYIYSAPGTFQTVSLPPSPAGVRSGTTTPASATSAPRRGVARPGWYR